MTVPAQRLLVTAVLLAGLTCTSVRAQDAHEQDLQKDLIGCWSADYHYDSLSNKDGSPTGAARLCSREPSAKACGDQSYLDVTYCFDRKGDAYGSETHCSPTKKGQICHGTDGLSGSYRLQGNQMNFFEAAQGEENSDNQELAWSCSFSISGTLGVLEFSDCTRSMNVFFRDCRDSEEYKSNKCELTSR